MDPLSSPSRISFGGLRARHLARSQPPPCGVCWRSLEIIISTRFWVLDSFSNFFGFSGCAWFYLGFGHKKFEKIAWRNTFFSSVRDTYLLLVEYRFAYVKSTYVFLDKNNKLCFHKKNICASRRNT